MGSILRLNRPKISSEIDVIQWDRIKSGKDPAVKLNKVFESPTEDNSNAETSDDPDIGKYVQWSKYNLSFSTIKLRPILTDKLLILAFLKCKK